MSGHAPIINSFVSKCDACAREAPRIKVDPPLQPIKPPAGGVPFRRWGLDCIGPMKESRKGNKYIVSLVCHSTKWVVAVAVPRITAG